MNSFRGDMRGGKCSVAKGAHNFRNEQNRRWTTTGTRL